MAKKKVVKSKSVTKHESFKLTPRNYPKEKLLIYSLAAFFVGLAIGWLLKDQYAAVLGVTTI
jgi:hypothetical protein